MASSSGTKPEIHSFISFTLTPLSVLRKPSAILHDFAHCGSQPNHVGRLDIDHSGLTLTLRNDGTESAARLYLRSSKLIDFRCVRPIVGKYFSIIQLNNFVSTRFDNDTVNISYAQASKHLSLSFGNCPEREFKLEFLKSNEIPKLPFRTKFYSETMLPTKVLRELTEELKGHEKTDQVVVEIRRDFVTVFIDYISDVAPWIVDYDNNKIEPVVIRKTKPENILKLQQDELSRLANRFFEEKLPESAGSKKLPESAGSKQLPESAGSKQLPESAGSKQAEKGKTSKKGGSKEGSATFPPLVGNILRDKTKTPGQVATQRAADIDWQPLVPIKKVLQATPTWPPKSYGYGSILPKNFRTIPVDIEKTADTTKISEPVSRDKGKGKISESAGKEKEKITRPPRPAGIVLREKTETTQSAGTEKAAEIKNKTEPVSDKVLKAEKEKTSESGGRKEEKVTKTTQQGGIELPEITRTTQSVDTEKATEINKIPEPVVSDKGKGKISESAGKEKAEKGITSESGGRKEAKVTRTTQPAGIEMSEITRTTQSVGTEKAAEIDRKTEPVVSDKVLQAEKGITSESGGSKEAKVTRTTQPAGIELREITRTTPSVGTEKAAEIDRETEPVVSDKGKAKMSESAGKEKAETSKNEPEGKKEAAEIDRKTEPVVRDKGKVKISESADREKAETSKNIQGGRKEGETRVGIHHAWFKLHDLKGMHKASFLQRRVDVRFCSDPENNVFLAFDLQGVGELVFLLKAQIIRQEYTYAAVLLKLLLFSQLQDE